MKRRYKTSPEVRERIYEYRRNNKDKVRRVMYAYNLKQYGLTPDDVKIMLLKQHHRCLICKLRTKLVVDHCHKSTKIRGLLCALCNRMLGLYEKEKALGRFDRYLETHG